MLIPTDKLRAIIKECSKLDVEAFEARTKLLRVFHDLCDEVEELRKKK